MKEITKMTKEEAVKALEEILIDLAKHAVFEKKLVDRAEELEKYIASLEEGAGNDQKTE